MNGLVLNGFVTYGIQLLTAGTNIVTGCIVGLDPTGTVKVGADMLRGIWVNDSPGNTIGGTTKGAGNVVSGNANGIAIENAGSTGNLVQGNVIGLGTDGSIIANSKAGVRIALGATATRVGLTSPTGRNVISGNAIGISLRDAESQSNQVQGNYIGTDATGTEARPNGTGILISEANRNTIGGTSSSAGNVVSGNTGVGIDVQGVTDGGNKIFGNLVGTTAAGTAPLPNASGIRLLNCTVANHVGTAGGGNVVSGNTGNGVNINQSNNQFVQGNVIGTSRDGSTAIPNGLNGVQVAGNDTTIGGGVSNLIASNTQSGVLVRSGVGNTITGNEIQDNGGRGIDLGGNGFLPNDPHDADNGPNDLQNFPDLTPLVPVSATSIPGTLDSTATTVFTVEVFSNAQCPGRQRPGRDVARHGHGDDGRLGPRELLAPPDEPAAGGADPHRDGHRLRTAARRSSRPALPPWARPRRPPRRRPHGPARPPPRPRRRPPPPRRRVSRRRPRPAAASRRRPCRRGTPTAVRPTRASRRSSADSTCSSTPRAPLQVSDACPHAS